MNDDIGRSLSEVDVQKRVEELAEGQSRFMNSIFSRVNDLSARVIGLEETVRRQQLMIDTLIRRVG